MVKIISLLAYVIIVTYKNRRGLIWGTGDSMTAECWANNGGNYLYQNYDNGGDMQSLSYSFALHGKIKEIVTQK